MNATTAAAEALTAVQADPVLGRLEWEAMGQYKIAAAQPFPVALKFDFLGQWSATVAGVYLLDEEVRVVRTRFCLTMVDLASAEVSRTLAACRAVDPEVARLRAELEAARAELALRKQNDADWQAERDAVAREAATAYARGWQDGRDADALTPPGVTEPAAERGGDERERPERARRETMTDSNPTPSAPDPRATTNPQIEAWFTYHAPTPEQKLALEGINAAAKAFAYAIDRYCHSGADKSAAFRLVREARMTANASIVVPVVGTLYTR